MFLEYEAEDKVKQILKEKEVKVCDLAKESAMGNIDKNEFDKLYRRISKDLNKVNFENYFICVSSKWEDEKVKFDFELKEI